MPFEDKKAVECAFQFCRDIQPDIIVTHEWHDFYSISRFAKDPQRINSLQGELDAVSDYFKQLRRFCPDSRIIHLKSNHLERLKKYLWKQAKELTCLRALDITTLLNLDKHNIEFMDIFSYRGFMFKHGDLVRKYSGYSARWEFEREGTNGASGHVHRLGQYYISRRGGNYTWLECGCLCNLQPEWFEGIPNWQHGIGMVTFKGNTKHFVAHAIPIIHYEILRW